MMAEGILSSVHQLQHRVGYYHISYSVQLCFFVIGPCQQIRLLFVLYVQTWDQIDPPEPRLKMKMMKEKLELILVT